MISAIVFVKADVARIPEDAGPAPKGMRLVEVPDLGAAFSRLF